MCLSVYSEFVEFSSNADWGYILAIRQCRRFDRESLWDPGAVNDNGGSRHA